MDMISKDRFNKIKNVLFTVFKYLVLVLWTVIVIFPLLAIIFTSFKSDKEYITTTIFELPGSFLYFNNYVKAFKEANLGLAFWNSFVLVSMASILNVLFGSMVAYCLSRFDFKFKGVIKFIYIASAMIPSITLHVSIYPMLRDMGFLNSMGAPVILYASTDIIQIWLYLQFLDKISYSLDESAMIEGASYFRIFVSIVFPLMMPAHMTVLILKFVTTYNDLFIQSIYMSGPELKTVTTALITFSGNRINAQNLMSAAIIMIMIPTIFIFLTLQKYILNGITAGSIKE